MNNIILIGMPASGKSTLGLSLAQMLGMSFLDTDDVLQQKLGKPLQEAIDDHGIDHFLRQEAEAILSIQVDHCVIATGGSAVYSPAAMAHLKQDGLCVYLSVPFSSIQTRLQNLSTRGVVLPAGRSLHDLHRERTPLYEHYCDVLFFEDSAQGDRPVEAHARELIFLLRRGGQLDLP